MTRRLRPCFVIALLLGWSSTASAAIIGVDFHSATIALFAPGTTPIMTGPFDVPLGDVGCVSTGACIGPLQLPSTIVPAFGGLVTSEATAGIIAGFAGDSWGLLPTIGTGVGQDDPFNLTAASATLIMNYQIGYLLDAAGLPNTAIQELLHLTGTVGDGGFVFAHSLFDLTSEALGLVAFLDVEFFSDTPGAFKTTLSGVDPGSGPLPAFDTFTVSGQYIFQASNANGPSSIHTALAPSSVAEPSALVLLCLGLSGAATRIRQRRRDACGKPNSAAAELRGGAGLKNRPPT